MAINTRLYPWFKFCQNLVFWQAVWFLYFQDTLSPAEAILLYAVYDVGTTAMEVPSGYLSDRLGRRRTLVAAAAAGLAGAFLLTVGDSFAMFGLAQVLLGASAAFASGTDSALLYESLAAQGRQDEIEKQEMRAWRFSFTALAVSAVVGGIMALQADVLPFAAGTAAAALLLALSLGFREPSHVPDEHEREDRPARLASLKSAFTEPVLIWLFWLSVLMYVFSHIPFVFGQPFILEAMNSVGMAGEAPLVSGLVSATMMVLSVIASLVAPTLRYRLGLATVLLTAFGMQIALSGSLALTNDAFAIALLFLRMVPDALSRPFIIARIQPLLRDDSRATYMSLQSLAGRLIFAGALMLASAFAADGETMAYAEIQAILGWSVVVGVFCFAALAVAAVRVRIESGSGH